MGILDALAGGLRQAGGILNPAVAVGLEQEQQMNMQAQDKRRDMITRQVIAAAENGALPAAQAKVALQRLGVDLPLESLGPNAQTQERLANQQKDMQFRSEIEKLGPTPDYEQMATLATKYGKPELAVQYATAKENREARIQSQADALEVRRSALDQQKELALSRAADQKERDAVTAQFRQQSLALQSQIASSNAEMRRLGLDLKRDQLNQQGDQQGNKRVQQLGTALEKANLPEADAVLGAVESALTKTPNLAEYLSGPKSLIPDMMVDPEIRAGRQAFQKLFNITLKNRSGAAVTPPEFERLKAEFGNGAFKTPDQLQNAVNQAREIIGKHYASIASGFGKDTLDAYNANVEEIGGRTVGSGAAPAAAPAAPAGLAGQVKAAGWSYEPTKYDYRVVDGKVQRKAK